MLFFDTNSYLIHHELNNDIKKLEKNKEEYLEEIMNDKLFIEKMKDSLNRRVAGESLSENEAREIMLRIGQGEINPSQIAAFLFLSILSTSISHKVPNQISLYKS